MDYGIYDYVDAHGENQIKSWANDLQKTERAKLAARIDMLAAYGDRLFPDILAGSSVAGIFKLKVHGKVQLRPLLCRGPQDSTMEYTLLVGATERDSKLEPKNAHRIAEDRRATVASDKNRRCKHERVT